MGPKTLFYLLRPLYSGLPGLRFKDSGFEVLAGDFLPDDGRAFCALVRSSQQIYKKRAARSMEFWDWGFRWLQEFRLDLQLWFRGISGLG